MRRHPRSEIGVDKARVRSGAEYDRERYNYEQHRAYYGVAFDIFTDERGERIRCENVANVARTRNLTVVIHGHALRRKTGVSRPKGLRVDYAKALAKTRSRATGAVRFARYYDRNL